MDIHTNIRKLAKSVRIQNIFGAAKDLQSIKIFRNECDFTNLQEEFLSYLYFYESIARDIIVEKISKHVYDKDLYEDAYYLWKQEKSNKTDKKSNSNQDVRLVMGTSIIFPKTEDK